MSRSESHSQFSDQLVGIQKRLYAYILTLLPWPQEASDVLQQTNLVMWRDADRFQPGTDFRAWAYRVAYYQVLAQRRKNQRDHLRFDDSLVRDLAANMDCEEAGVEEESVALKDCLRRLPETDRKLISRRYDAGVSVKTMAADLDQSPNALAVRLHRVRHKLLECVQERLSEQDSK